MIKKNTQYISPGFCVRKKRPIWNSLFIRTRPPVGQHSSFWSNICSASHTGSYLHVGFNICMSQQTFEMPFACPHGTVGILKNQLLTAAASEVPREVCGSFFFFFPLGGCLGGDEAEPAGGKKKISNRSRSSKEIRGSEDEDTCQTNFSTFIEEVPLTPPAFRESFQLGVGHYSGKEKKRREKEHDWPRRPWCPRGASQHVVTPNLSSCQTKVQTFITASWPWLSLPRGFHIKDKSKTPHFISSLPHASSVDFTIFIFFFSSTCPPAHPLPRRQPRHPYGQSPCLANGKGAGTSRNQSVTTAAALPKRKEKKKRKK